MGIFWGARFTRRVDMPIWLTRKIKKKKPQGPQRQWGFFAGHVLRRRSWLPARNCRRLLWQRRHQWQSPSERAEERGGAVCRRITTRALLHGRFGSRISAAPSFHAVAPS